MKETCALDSNNLLESSPKVQIFWGRITNATQWKLAFFFYLILMK